MAGWTSQEVAVWIRGAVQEVQLTLEEWLRANGQAQATVCKDGLFSAALWAAYKSAAAAATGESGTTIENQGPRALASTFLGVSHEIARGFEVAWAWWVAKRVASKPTNYLNVLASYNDGLTADGDQILTPVAAEEFVGDKPASSGGGTLRWVVPFALGGLIVGTVIIGWQRRPSVSPWRDRSAMRRSWR